MNWEEDAAYIRSIRPYILLSVYLFFATAVLGFVASVQNPELAATYVGDVAEKLQWILDLSPPKMMMAIFLNNLFASLMALLLGVGFGIIPSSWWSRTGSWSVSSSIRRCWLGVWHSSSSLSCPTASSNFPRSSYASASAFGSATS